MLGKFARLTFIFSTVLYFTTTPLIAKETSNEKTVEQARKTVQMLDDLYKTFIVLITQEYVKDPSVVPAATLSKKVFEAMEKKGWHKVRLLDATGKPFNQDNSPKDEFENAAIEAIKSGKSYFERVEEINGTNYLRAATIVPVVMDRCTISH